MVLQIAEYLRKLSRKERGFTLIELVIVVAIIAILIAVAIPIYQNVTRTAAQRSHDTNLRTIDSAVSQYFMKMGDYPSASADATGTTFAIVGSGVDEFLEDVPTIPDLLVTIGVEEESVVQKNGLTEVGLADSTDSTNLNQYFLYEDEKGVWAGPTGQWENAYRQGKKRS